MLVRHDQYIFPPRSKDAIPRADTGIFGMLGWIAQLKYNDSHTLIKYCPDGTIELWNRHAERFRTYHAPDWLIEELKIIGDRLGVTPGTVTILDGGLLDQKHAAIKDSIVIWDILVHNDEHLIGTTYQERYDQLLPHAKCCETGDIAKGIVGWMYKNKTHEPINFGPRFTPNIFMPYNYGPGSWDNLWDIAATVNAPYTVGTPGSPNYDCKPVIEGLLLKDPSGILGFGFKEHNNDEWMVKSRVRTGRHLF